MEKVRTLGGRVRGLRFTVISLLRSGKWKMGRTSKKTAYHSAQTIVNDRECRQIFVGSLHVVALTKDTEITTLSLRHDKTVWTYRDLGLVLEEIPTIGEEVTAQCSNHGLSSR